MSSSVPDVAPGAPGAGAGADGEAPAVKVSRRTRKKMATRQALRYAALELVAERGATHVTIEDITEAADVSIRTFFNYFNSKEEAVFGLDPQSVERLRASLLARPATESAIEAVREVVVEQAAWIDQEFDALGEERATWIRRFSIARRDPDLLGAYVGRSMAIERTLGEALAQRLGRDYVHDPFPALVTATVFAASRVAGLYWVEDGEHAIADLTRAAIDAVANGLTNLPGSTD